MADPKIVTKKTAVKPAAPTGTRAATAPATRKTGTTPAPGGRTPAAAAATKAATGPKVPASKAVTPPPETAAPQGNPLPPMEDKPVSLQYLASVTPEQRQEMIREAAYYKAEKRNFTGGSDAEDWAAAEREIDELLAKARQIREG